ncbi:MAG: hypothetical protein KF768_13410 [Phycisphaeraceae bacterium]|nr:hypothetical protein [Phycisphaeraceae bacterium]
MTLPSERTREPARCWTLLESGDIVGADGAVVASSSAESLLATLALARANPGGASPGSLGPAPIVNDRPARPIVRWSGSYAEVDGDDGDDGDEPTSTERSTVVAVGGWGDGSGGDGGACFRADPRTWMGAYGWRALDEALRTNSANASVDRPLILRTHARHVLSDVPSVLRFLRAAEFARAGLLLDAVSMLTPAMVASPQQAVDHLTRLVEDVRSPAFATLPPLFAVLLGQVGVVGVGEEGKGKEGGEGGTRSEDGLCVPLPFESEGPVSVSLLEALEQRLLEQGLAVIRPAHPTP